MRIGDEHAEILGGHERHDLCALEAAVRPPCLNKDALVACVCDRVCDRHEAIERLTRPDREQNHSDANTVPSYRACGIGSASSGHWT